jgi:hypothetical protein
MWYDGPRHIFTVMPGLVPGIHVLPGARSKDVDGRAKASGSDAVLRTAMPGHDESIVADVGSP